jgi:predicted nicotinamide N-methyase
MIEVHDTAPIFGSPETYRLEWPYQGKSELLDSVKHVKILRNIRVRSQRAECSQRLFCDDLWPGSLLAARYLLQNSSSMCAGKRVIELGCGAPLPSSCACVLGASLVVATDHPSSDVLSTVSDVIESNKEDLQGIMCGHELDWADFEKIKNETIVSSPSSSSSTASKLLETYGPSFDLAVLAECLWKDTVHLHRPLCLAIQALVVPGGKVLVTYGDRLTDTHTSADNYAFIEMAVNDFGFRAEHIKSIKEFDDVSAEQEKVDMHIFILMSPAA